MTDRKLEEIIKGRDEFEFGSLEWNQKNEEKADYLESIKPSTRERIVYFEEENLGEVPKVFSSGVDIFDFPFAVDRRSLLEYHPTRRHPIPYVVIRFQDKYFFILRESGGGELRLIGKKGLVGGHVGEEDLQENSLEKTFENALKREVFEEVGVGDEIIKSIELKGLIRSDLGVDIDHLGLIYEMEILTDEIKSEEEGVLTGIWIDKKDLEKHYESFENWSKIVFDNLLK